jgi:hypothetical protein
MKLLDEVKYLQAGGPGSGRHPGPNHYMSGYKKGQGLWQKFSSNSWEGVQYHVKKLSDNYESKNGSNGGEFHRGMRDGFHGSNTTHGVYNWRGDGQYQKAVPVHTTDRGETKAREWLEENISTLPSDYQGVVRKVV